MGCIVSRGADGPSSSPSFSSSSSGVKKTVKKEGEKADEIIKTVEIFFSKCETAEEALRDEKRRGDVVHVFLQSFYTVGASSATEGGDDAFVDTNDDPREPPRLREYCAELQMREKRKKKNNNINNNEVVGVTSPPPSPTAAEWVSLGSKNFTTGKSGSLVPVRDAITNTNLMPMNAAPMWALPSKGIGLSTAFRVKVFHRDFSHQEDEKIDTVSGDDSHDAKDEKIQSAVIEDVKKSFLEETGRMSPSAMSEEEAKQDTEDELLESLLTDPRLDEIFNENNKSDGSLGCVLFTLSTLLPPPPPLDTIQPEDTTKDDESTSTTKVGKNSEKGKGRKDFTAAPMGVKRRNSGELIVLDSRVCYFDVGYRGVVSSLAYENVVTIKDHCKDGGFLCVARLKKLIEDEAKERKRRSYSVDAVG